MLDGIGQQFLATGKLYDTMFDQGHIDAATYRPWFVFATKFKLVYKSVVETWNKALTIEDSREAADVAISLKNELLQFFYAAQLKGQNL